MIVDRLKVAPTTLALLGLLAFAVLAVRFSPNWLPFCRLVEEVQARAVNAEEGRALEQALFHGHSVNRATHVLQQTRDLGAEIAEPIHKIVRWRLLMPALGHGLNLPGWVVLGLAQVGCVALVLALVAIGSRRPDSGGRPAADALCFGIVAGASAPFFTSMGLLGYYDSWLALALLAVAFARRRWLVLLACVLAPWIDERFVIGFPLAVCVRRILQAEAGLPRWQWLRREALWPAVVVLVYSVVRLQLGGSGGSQTAAQYLREFVFSQTLTVSERVFGVWQGLRVGWVLVALALLGSGRLLARGLALEAGLLVAGTVLTGLFGSWAALDTSRSMVLLLPVVPLGWLLAHELPWWRRVYAPMVLAGAALVLPAWHCLGTHFQPVDTLWSGAWPEAAARNNLGNLLAGSPGRQEEAVAHYEEALRLKPRYAEAHNNLGIVLAGRPGGQDRALAHYTEAIRLKPDYAEAHYNLANLFAVAPGRHVSAIAHYTHALRLNPGYVEAHVNLAVVLAGAGRQDDALTYYKEALRLRPGFAAVHNNLALLLATMPGRQSEALAHFAEAARLSPQSPGVNFNYARELEKTAGGKPEAEAYYLRALTLDPNFAEARAALDRLRRSP